MGVTKMDDPENAALHCEKPNHSLGPLGLSSRQTFCFCDSWPQSLCGPSAVFCYGLTGCRNFTVMHDARMRQSGSYIPLWQSSTCLQDATISVHERDARVWQNSSKQTMLC